MIEQGAWLGQSHPQLYAIFSEPGRKGEGGVAPLLNSQPIITIRHSRCAGKLCDRAPGPSLADVLHHTWKFISLFHTHTPASVGGRRVDTHHCLSTHFLSGLHYMQFAIRQSFHLNLLKVCVQEAYSACCWCTNAQVGTELYFWLPGSLPPPL